MDPDAVVTARALLPAWLPWVPALAIPAAGLLAWVVGRLSVAVALHPFRHAPVDPWPARARLALPARVTALYNLVYAPVIAAVAVRYGVGPLSVVPSRALALLAAVTALAGAVAVQLTVARRIHGPGFLPLSWLRGQLALTLVRLPHLVLAGLTALVLPDPWTATARAVLVLAVFLPSMVFLAAGGGIWLADAAGLVSPVPPRLATAVDRVVARMGVTAPPAAVVVLPAPVANAWTLVTLRRVVFTQGALDALDDTALEALCARQVAALDAGRPLALVRTGIACIAAMALVAGPTVMRRAGPVGLYALVFATLGVLVLVARRTQRIDAAIDAQGRQHEGPPAALAYAMEALFHANLAPLVGRARRAVAPYDRLVAGGAVLPYPRPAPPDAGWMWVAVVLCTAGNVAGTLGIPMAAEMLPRNEPTAALVAVAITGGTGQTLGRLAYARSQQDDPDAAAVFYAAESVADPGSVYAPANQAIVLAGQDRCDDAARAANEARSRWAGHGTSRGAGHVVQRADEAVRACTFRRTPP